MKNMTHTRILNKIVFANSSGQLIQRKVENSKGQSITVDY